VSFTDRQTDRETGRQIERQTDRQTGHPPCGHSCAPVSSTPCISKATTQVWRNFISNALLICWETRTRVDWFNT